MKPLDVYWIYGDEAHRLLGTPDVGGEGGDNVVQTSLAL
jgi:hypothetical protein